MSLVEWIGERFSPGPIGAIENEAPAPGHWDPRLIVARGVVALGLSLASITWILSATESSGAAAIALLFVATYCLGAYRFSPRPDLDNVGWLGGLVDNPFRISDDYNRLLVVVAVVLWPGRFVTVSLRDFVGFLRGRRVMVFPARDE